MRELRSRVNEGGRLVIPAAYRKALGIEAGDEVILRLADGELRVSTVRHALGRARRLVRKHVPAEARLSESLIEDRRDEAARE